MDSFIEYVSILPYLMNETHLKSKGQVFLSSTADVCTMKNCGVYGSGANQR